MKVSLVGIGMDGVRTLTQEAAEAIDSADLLIGASRMLAPFAALGKRQENCYDFRKIGQILLEAAEDDEEYNAADRCTGSEKSKGRESEDQAAAIRTPEVREKPVQEAVILLSGDTGFFSGAKKLLQHLNEISEQKLMQEAAVSNGYIDGTDASAAGAGQPMFDIRVLPGISSLAALCAKSGLSYENMKIISLHGREDNIAIHVLQNAQTFFLLGGKIDAAALCRCLCLYGLPDVTLHIGENLGTDAERVTHGKAQELCDIKTDYLAVAIAENPAPLMYLPCGIEDEAFIRVIKENAVPADDSLQDAAAAPEQKTAGITADQTIQNAFAGTAHAGDTGRMNKARAQRTIPMTKSEIRAAAVAKLNIRRNDICWDIGCGTGSVSVEMALRCPHGMVYGYDKNEAAAELTMRNARKFSCDNIRTAVCSFPPQTLQEQDALPAPDRVFIGGASGRVDEILELALRLNPDVRVLITSVSLETLENARAAMMRLFGRCSVTQLAVTKAEKVGSVSMLKARNPIFIIEA